MAASFTWSSFLKCWPINSEFYCTVLSDSNAHLQGEGGLLVLITKGALVLQDDAQDQTANRTTCTLPDLSSEALPHPPYSPDLALSDFGLIFSYYISSPILM